MGACLAPGEYFGERVAQREFGALLLTESLFAPRAKLPSHEHAAATFCFVLQGAFDEITPGKQIEAQEGMLLFRPPGHRHSDSFLKAGGRTLGLDLTWTDERVPREPISLNSPQIGRLGGELYREFRRNDTCSPLAIEGLLLVLQAELGRAHARSEVSRPAWLLRVEEQLADSFRENLTLAELATTGGVHPAHLSREFQRFHGCTLGQHVRKLRVEYGMRKLAAGGQPIGDIALDAGFCDQAHFTRAFREFTGTTPAEYRRQAL